MKYVTEKLSKIPSEILSQALTDLGKCERASKYIINMVSWHSGDVDGCQVCLAGSYLAQTVGVPYWTSVNSPSTTPEPVQKRMQAIESFRCGHILKALTTLEISEARRSKLPEEITMPTYQKDDPKSFKRAIRGLITQLQGAGL